MENKFAKRRQWGPSPSYQRVESYIPPHGNFISIAGPCSVESAEQINDIAAIVKALGATHLRGGCFRAGTYPGQNFGWIDLDLIKAFQTVANWNKMQNIVEVFDHNSQDTWKALKFADCVQVGCRQQQNYPLLRFVGNLGRPVFLKRHPGSTIDEFLGSAEHVLTAGCKELYLIERGSSTNHTHVRWDLSISMIPAIQAITNIPIICDASHGTGRRDLVEPMALAGVAAGANGLLVEVHADPEKSISDSDQAITPKTYKELVQKVNKVWWATHGGTNNEEPQAKQ